jgi:hypothetical protein
MPAAAWAWPNTTTPFGLKMLQPDRRRRRCHRHQNRRLMMIIHGRSLNGNNKLFPERTIIESIEQLNTSKQLIAINMATTDCGILADAILAQKYHQPTFLRMIPCHLWRTPRCLK